MRTFDEQGNELFEYDLALGYLTIDERFVMHHEAVDAVEEVSHYEVIKTYPNGGRDVARIVDVPAVQAQDAWDEYETVQVYHLAPPKPSEDEDKEPTQLDRIEAQVYYTAMMTDTLMEA